MNDKVVTARERGKGMESVAGQVLVAALCFAAPALAGPLVGINTGGGRFLTAITFGPLLIMLVSYLRRRVLERE